jgi:hypothetical protein
MTVKPNITQTRSAVRVLAVLFIMAFVLSFTSVALSQGCMQGDRGSLNGEIVGIGNVGHAQIVTLRLGHFPNDMLNIFLNKDTKLQVCNASKPLMWSEGGKAIVRYHQIGGVVIADSIFEKC